MNVPSTLGGLAGACALTLLNEGVKRIDKNAPRLDLLGQNAIAKLMKGNDILPKTTSQVFPLAGDIITNSLYYGLSRGDSKRNTLIRGALLGVGAGIGAVALPEQLGLPPQHTAKSTKTKLLTVAWYLIGGLVAAAVTNALDKHPISANKELKSGAISAGKTIVKQKVKSTLQNG